MPSLSVTAWASACASSRPNSQPPRSACITAAMSMSTRAARTRACGELRPAGKKPACRCAAFRLSMRCRSSASSGCAASRSCSVSRALMSWRPAPRKLSGFKPIWATACQQRSWSGIGRGALAGHRHSSRATAPPSARSSAAGKSSGRQPRSATSARPVSVAMSSRPMSPAQAEMVIKSWLPSVSGRAWRGPSLWSAGSRRNE